MKPYPKYKDSGIEWIGEIPAHWDVARMKWVLSRKMEYGANESAESDNPQYPRFIRITDFDDSGKLRNESFRSLPPDVAKDYLLDEGDILFARSGATVGKTFIFRGYNGKACFAGYLIRAKCNPDLITSDFLYLFTRSGIYASWKNSIFIQATIQNISAEKYHNLVVPVPQLVEQQSIATYLDRKTKQIEGLIEKKQYQIDLLWEQRTAVINEAVTKGLNPKAKMKDSGIEWIGEIPAHWDVSRIVFALERLQDGTHFSPDSNFKGEYLYITAKNIKEWGIDLTDITYVSKETHEAIYKRCPVLKGDVLYIKDGATAGIATVNPLEEPFSMLSSVAMLRPKQSRCDSRYLAYHLNAKTFKGFVLNSLIGGAMTRFTLETISKFRIIVPPLTEQQSIATYLDLKTSEYDTMIAKEERLIELLQEYRTSLISEVVTGKVDVRNEN
jgi:type I restriction enzyme S subunit